MKFNEPLLFVDTEWADTLGHELVSIALVSLDGQHEFYAERDPLPTAPTDFVRSVVFPLLNRGDKALSEERMTAALHDFFERFLESAPRGKCTVCFDYRNDIDLLNYVLDGFESPDTRLRPPFALFNLNLLGHEFDAAVEHVFAKDTGLKARRHHALVDAWANRDAFVAVREKYEASLEQTPRGSRPSSA